jgi:Cu/Ag efflux pump CusA
MAVNPGPGSVIYRGLAAVNIGGVVVSLVFTLVLIPALMRLLQVRVRARPAGEPEIPVPVSP